MEKEDKSKKKKERKIVSPLEEEYMIHQEEDNDELYWAKECIKNEFTPVQRKIFITYMELGNYRLTAEEFKVSQPTVQKYIRNLVSIIHEYICNHI